MFNTVKTRLQALVDKFLFALPKHDCKLYLHTVVSNVTANSAAFKINLL